MFTVVIIREDRPAPAVYNCHKLSTAQAIGRPTPGETVFIYDAADRLVETHKED